MKLTEFLPRHPSVLWTLAKQAGVTHAAARLPQAENGRAPWDYAGLADMRKEFERFGFRLEVLEPGPDNWRIKSGLAGRDEEIAAMKELLRNMGAAGIPVLCYNFMARFRVLRTSTRLAIRGGALTSGYDHSLAERLPLEQMTSRFDTRQEASLEPQPSEEAMWEHLRTFLEQVVPVAEKAKVKLALHPDDPPVSPIRGTARIIRDAESLQRAIDLVPSEFSGITYCQGVMAAAGESIPDTIRRFGRQNKLFYAHFRDVEGNAESFVETFHDAGKTDMFEAVRAYKEVGFDGPIRVDHVPIMGEPDDPQPEPEAIGRMYALGYLKGLIHGAVGSSAPSVRPAADEAVAASAERAHAEIWSRFIKVAKPGAGIVLDYAGLDGAVSLPTPDECREGKPNALAWWCPMENGSFFNGLYLDGLLARWKHTGAAEDAAKARTIAAGLLLLADVGDNPGFVARGVSDDGVSHYTIGSDDQTSPWFYGLWKYAQSGLCGPGERAEIAAKMTVVAEAVRSKGWKIPCDGHGFDYLSDWNQAHFVHAVRVLFMLKIVYALTGDERWQTLYTRLGEEKPESSPHTRFELCSFGILDEEGSVYECDWITEQTIRSGEWRKGKVRKFPYWISISSQASLKELVELEGNPAICELYRAGLRANGRRALAYIQNPRCTTYNPDNGFAFDTDWRFLNELWFPQSSVEESRKLAALQLLEWNTRSPRKLYEAQYVREPLFAGWFVLLSGDERTIAEAQPALGKLLTQYDWSDLYYSLFFVVEAIYYQNLAMNRS